MALKNPGPPSRIHWREAVAYIGFDLMDADQHFTILPIVKAQTMTKGEARQTARRAVEELAQAIAAGSLKPIWVGLDDDSPDDLFGKSRLRTEEDMVRRLDGVINLSGDHLNGLYFWRAEVLQGWPKPEPVSATSGAASRCTEWMSNKVRGWKADRASPVPKYRDVETEALKKFPAAGKRGFKRVWDANAPDEWKRPGPKRQRQFSP